MARVGTGQVVERKTKRGTAFAIRFSVDGTRHYYTLGYSTEGWSRKKAEAELQNVLADARRGIWQPPTEAVPEPARSAPTFREYAADWLAMREPELAASTVERMHYALLHLNGWFGDTALDQITTGDVDRYKADKLREGKLGGDSINKSLKLLAQILDYAMEDDGWIERNPAKGKRRRVSVNKPRRTWLDTADQIAALLDAVSLVDRRTPWETQDRAMLSTLTFAGLRIGEMLNLRRRDVDLASGRIRVLDSKTDAGERDVNILPVLRDDLSAYMAERELAPDALLFANKKGERSHESNLRNRLLAPCVKAANEMLVDAGRAPMSGRITPHSLRRTFASILVALGEDPAYVMSQLGHTDPAFTLRIYAQVMSDRSGEKERINSLVSGANLALNGTSGESDARPSAAPDSFNLRNPAPRAA
jgi:integrase